MVVLIVKQKIEDLYMKRTQEKILVLIIKTEKDNCPFKYLNAIFQYFLTP